MQLQNLPQQFLSLTPSFAGQGLVALLNPASETHRVEFVHAGFFSVTNQFYNRAAAKHGVGCRYTITPGESQRIFPHSDFDWSLFSVPNQPITFMGEHRLKRTDSDLRLEGRTESGEKRQLYVVASLYIPNCGLVLLGEPREELRKLG